MKKQSMIKSLSIALGAIFSVSLAIPAISTAAENPFSSKPVSGGYMMLAEGKCGEGKCGAGKCGTAKSSSEGKCGMGRMDADGNGDVTKEEFMQGHEAMFTKIDQNGDGVIDPAERAAHMDKMKGFMKDVNDDEVEDMIEFCIEHDFTLRFIETMPVGDTGRDATSYYLSLQDVKKRLAERYELLPDVMPGGGPARYVQVAGTDLRIGFITPISQHFCETCNRARLAVDGTLYLCLGQEHKFEFRPLLRAGISDSELQDAARTAITLKPERHEFREKPQQVVRFMAKTGG